MWLAVPICELMHKSGEGEWSEFGPSCHIVQSDVTTFCNLVKDGNRAHDASNRRAVVPGALLFDMLPALMPDLYEACLSSGLVLDAGAVRAPGHLLQVGSTIQARIRVMSSRPSPNGRSIRLDISVEIIFEGKPEKVLMRGLQSVIIKKKVGE